MFPQDLDPVSESSEGGPSESAILDPSPILRHRTINLVNPGHPELVPRTLSEDSEIVKAGTGPTEVITQASFVHLFI